MFDVVGIISNAAIKALVTFSLVAFPFLFSPACIGSRLDKKLDIPFLARVDFHGQKCYKE